MFDILIQCLILPEEDVVELKVKLEGRRRLCKASSSSGTQNDDVGLFSGIADFDSPSPSIITISTSFYVSLFVSMFYILTIFERFSR